MRPMKVRVEDIRRDGKLIAQVVHVAPGTLVQYDGVGVQINCAFNDPEYGCQPYVSIDTSELPPEHTYDEKDPSKPGGMPKIAVHLNDGAELYDDMGAGDTTHSLVYVVRPEDVADDVAVFINEDDADVFAQTFMDPDDPCCCYPDPEHAIVCDRRLAAQMIAQRKEDDDA